MAALFAFVGIFLLSLLVAVLAALQLADFFRATEEFIVVLMALPVFALVAMLVFAAAYAGARTPRVFHRVAIFLAIITAMNSSRAWKWIASCTPTSSAANCDSTKMPTKTKIVAIIAVFHAVAGVCER